MEEQEFLLRHYEELQKKPDKDPRGAFRNVEDVGVPTAGMVGPMASSGLNIPLIEKAFTDVDGRGSSPQSGETRRGLRRVRTYYLFISLHFLTCPFRILRHVLRISWLQVHRHHHLPEIRRSLARPVRRAAGTTEMKMLS